METEKQRFRSAEVLADVLCGMTVLVLVVLLLFDIYALGVGACINDELAIRAFCAAANKAR